MPDNSLIKCVFEPFIKSKIHSPKKYIGNIIALCESKRGIQYKIEFISEHYTIISYLLPMSETIFDFFDKLKSISKGFASLEYEFFNFQITQISKINILINYKNVDALSIITHNDLIQKKAQKICEKIKQLLPKQLYQIPIQAAIGNKIIARE